MTTACLFGQFIHLQVSAWEMFLHEVGDDVYIAGGHFQVHLHCESTAKPVRKTQKMSNAMVWMSWFRVG